MMLRVFAQRRKDGHKEAQKAQRLGSHVCAFCACLWRYRNTPRGVAVAFDCYSPDIARQGVVSHPFCPFDHYYSLFLSQQVVEVDGVRGAGAFIQTIEIDVVEM